MDSDMFGSRKRGRIRVKNVVKLKRPVGDGRIHLVVNVKIKRLGVVSPGSNWKYPTVETATLLFHLDISASLTYNRDVSLGRRE